MKYNLIVAICESRGIGYQGKLPWHSKADLLHFSKLTKGIGENAVIMGGATWASLSPLPKRNNLIVSSSLKLHSIMEDGHIIKSFTSIDDVVHFCELMEYDEVWIIGGETIYKQFLAMKIINKCYVTSIDKFYECDTFFPELNENEWTLNNTYTIAEKK